MYGSALGYLRHLRAFHFPRDYEQKDSIAELLTHFVMMIYEDDYGSLTKVYKLHKAFKTAKNHITYKAEND